ncbi:MAG: glycosyltransferase family 4 protein [Cyclobacteriaceae bacterium]|nr:glycosyltransferase family 4 protein [Cyclobacteriaceae bacterium]
MKIIINTSHQRFGGAIQVALSFIYECIQFPEHEYHVWVGSGIGKSLKEKDFPGNFTFYYFDFGVIDFSKIRRIQKTLESVENKIKPDIIMATSGPSYFHSKAPQVIGYNLGLYIYPESPYVKNLPLWRRIKLEIKKQIHFYFFRRDAAAYVVQTDDVNQRVRKELKTELVYTVTNTYNGFYEQQATFPNRLSPRQKNEIRLLTVSSYYPHKNLEIIPAVVKRLREKGVDNIRFVLTLKKEDYKNKIGAMPDIINVGPVKPEECPSLYKECDFMFLPTLAECFSASYPEAMIMEKPIITTDLGFARSICGESAVYYKPGDAEDAVQSILQLINDRTLQEHLISKEKEQLKKFDTAHSRAKKYLQICKEMHANKKLTRV